MQEKSPKSEVPSNSSASSPKCCRAHWESCSKKRNMDTSEWRFIEDDTRNCTQFDPWKCEMPSTQRKEKCIKYIDRALEQETRGTIIGEIKKVVTDKSNSAKASPSRNPRYETSDDDLKTNRKENEEILTNLKEYKVETNPYLVLLNRLDEEEGVKTPSVEDKLKLVEDRLRISISNFCEACDELVETTDSSDSADSKVNQLLKPEEVREAFRPKVFEPSLLPPQTLSVSEMNKKPIGTTTEGTEEAMPTKRQMKMKGIMKQGFYLPSGTWFTQAKETDRLTPEEIELLNSTSTKAFLRFLDERKKEPPKVLQEIRKKLQETQQFEKQNGNEK